MQIRRNNRGPKEFNYIACSREKDTLHIYIYIFLDLQEEARDYRCALMRKRGARNLRGGGEWGEEEDGGKTRNRHITLNTG